MRMIVATKRNDEWLTPPDITSRLGKFDLDPCSPVKRPWPTADRHMTIYDNGLMLPWAGRVWLNPPYSQLAKWLGRMAEHGNGIALAFARTDTRPFQEYVFPYAKTLFFIRGRLHFHTVEGARAKDDCGAPAVLISYTEYDAEMIEQSRIPGAHLSMSPHMIFVFEGEKTWRVIVDSALTELDGEAGLEQIYEAVMRIAPAKASNNKHYREKVRQVLQFYFKRVDKGVYSKAEGQQ
jgi:hypothetical protein